jgi:hypothetical protein
MSDLKDRVALLPVQGQHVPVLRSLLADVAPDAELVVLKDLVGGKSGAEVLLVDIVSGTDEFTGQFVLKLGANTSTEHGEPNEAARHQAVEQWNTSWTSGHVPKLVRSATTDAHAALLYETAGAAPSRLHTADAVAWNQLQALCGTISSEFAGELNAEYGTHHDGSVVDTLHRWLGYRVEPSEAPRLHSRLDELVGGGDAFVIGGRVLPDPRTLFRLDGQSNDAAKVRFDGMLHGDLHLGNILLEGRTQPTKDFWVIDFALARRGPLFYDQAYLECALLTRYLTDATPEQTFTILRAVWSDELKGLRLQDVGLGMCLREVQMSLQRWAQAREPRRADPFAAQWWLARVAAGLNWANKPVPDANARVALVYAAFAALAFMDRFAAAALTAARANVAPTPSGPPRQASARGVLRDRATLAPLKAAVWESLLQFDDRNAYYVLVAGRQKQAYQGIGALPWALVVDLDPDSDTGGLQAAARETLERRRSLQSFGLQVPSLEFDRATGWLMAAGWASHFEPPPASLREWRWKYPKALRTACEELRRAAAPRQVKCLVLPDAGENELASRVVETVEEVLQDQVEFIVLERPGSSDTLSQLAATTSLTVDEFLLDLADSYGDNVASSSAPQMPGVHGTVELAIATLRNLEEDLELLHSDVLFDSARGSRRADEFWRGSPPSWIDLQAGLDVPREALPEITSTLERYLSRRRNQTLELRHDPGSGGTTLARRVAWDLHLRHPTVILRRVTETTVDRLDQLFHIVDRPILLVVDNAVASVATREQIYRGLLSRNASVVILFVTRRPPIEPSKNVHLSDPMSNAEARQFARIYAHQTDEQEKRLQLRKIASGELEPPYHSPFFFGLFTYEREFRKVDSYVSSHLSEASEQARKVLAYLALVTRFGQIGVDEGLVAGWLGFASQQDDLDLESSLGNLAARLVVRTGRNCRLLHPIIAEEVLRQIAGDTRWQTGLHTLALGFIDAVTSVVHGDDEAARQLFSQLFIQRQSDGDAATGNFAAIIQEIPEPAGAMRVLARLTEVCPDEAHFWNHRGRYLSYVMKLDFEGAEAHLLRAVALTNEQDPVNYHTLGQVRRLWLEKRLTDLFRSEQRVTPTAVLSNVESLFDAAVESFATARALNPDQEHAYVTPIQMTLYVAEAMRRAAGDVSLAVLMTGESRASLWLRQQLPEAEELYAHLDHNRGQGTTSRYTLDVRRRLSAAFGDYDSLIASWETAVYATKDKPEMRRALAMAYLGRSGRKWAQLPTRELTRITDMMDSNLREHAGNNRDVRMWFDAYRRLPEFNLIMALERIGSWASRSDELDAHFYAYLIHFLMRRAGFESDDDRLQFHLRRAKDIAGGRGQRQYAYEWLGREPTWCPLVNHREMGRWNPATNFFEGSHERLTRVTGVIQRIDSPQSGRVVLEEGPQAFFLPGQSFRQSQHVGSLVNFFLGFSYEGFRAWEPELGQAPAAVAGGAPIQDVVSANGSSEEEAPAAAAPESSPRTRPVSVDQSPAGTLDIQDTTLLTEVAAAVRAIVAARQAYGVVRPKHITPLLLKQFPGPPVHTRLGFKSLREMLPFLEGIVLSEDGTVSTGGLKASPASRGE